MKAVRFTDHARQRMEEFGLERHEVIRVIRDPDCEYDTKDSRGDAGNKMHQRGEWAVVTGPTDHRDTTGDRRIVITILRKTTNGEGWTR